VLAALALQAEVERFAHCIVFGGVREGVRVLGEAEAEPFLASLFPRSRKRSNGSDQSEAAMTKTKGRNPIDINRSAPLGGGVAVYFDGVSLWLTFANVPGNEMSHISLDLPTFEQLLRFGKDRVGGDFAAAVVKVANES
jgi:hypothetical protein